MRIGLFVPCHIDAVFPQVGIATLELLERFGHDVVYPCDQTCCGDIEGVLIHGAQGVRSLSVLPSPRNP